MQVRAYIMTTLFVVSASFAQKGVPGGSFARWVVERNSSLNIQGETNINTFQCEVTEYLKADTLICAKNEGTKKLYFTNNGLTIDVRRFDCHNKFITEDFRSALKADRNPSLKILFVTIDDFQPSQNIQRVSGTVIIELASAIKQVDIDYTVRSLPGNRIQMNGSHLFSFSDFKLKAPKKLAGLIRTRDEIKVSFQLFFKAL